MHCSIGIEVQQQKLLDSSHGIEMVLFWNPKPVLTPLSF